MASGVAISVQQCPSPSAESEAKKARLQRNAFALPAVPVPDKSLTCAPVTFLTSTGERRAVPNVYAVKSCGHDWPDFTPVVRATRESHMAANKMQMGQPGVSSEYPMGMVDSELDMAFASSIFPHANTHQFYQMQCTQCQEPIALMNVERSSPDSLTYDISRFRTAVWLWSILSIVCIGFFWGDITSFRFNLNLVWGPLLAIQATCMFWMVFMALRRDAVVHYGWRMTGGPNPPLGFWLAFMFTMILLNCLAIVIAAQAVGTGQWDLWNTFSGQANSNLAALCAFAAINGFGAAILATSWPAGDRMVTLGDGWNTLQPCQLPPP